MKNFYNYKEKKVDSNNQYLPLDLKGKRFGFLTVLDVTHKGVGGYYWDCICDCGKKTNVLATRMVQGVTKSCGHLQGNKGVGKTHGMRHTRIYATWKNMKIRCSNEKCEMYHLYGGRGIKFCDKWLKFEGFYEDMKDGYNDELQLDRIDVNGNYCKENCRWATRKENANNKRNTVYITYNNETKTSSEWADIIGAKNATITKRVRMGYSPEECLYGKKYYIDDKYEKLNLEINRLKSLLDSHNIDYSESLNNK